MYKQLMRNSLLTLISLFFLSTSVFAQDGEKLFNGNCKSCHSPGENKVVGPGLKGVESRWADKKLLYKWIKNNKEVLAAGDPYATALFEKYNKSVMTSFPGLSDKDIDAILKYIADYKAPVAAVTPTTEATGQGAKQDNDLVLYILVGIGILFFVLINVLGGVKKSLNKLAAEKEGLEVPEDFQGTAWQKIKHWMSNNTKLVIIISIILVCWGSKVGWEALWNIGVYEGYRPEQPIKFSHKLHAGKNAINCVYCHGSAERGKAAGVPSANVCMNCHKYIQEGPQFGKEEIAKIYAALDYNPETQQYGPNKKPIKWIKVHNLPDHVYFNHSQHVVVGKVECQTCHGPVQEMDTVRQFSQLTMGWCINCHRETEVKMEGNEYYKELHAKLKEKYKGQKITVSKIGGLECSKCHY